MDQLLNSSVEVIEGIGPAIREDMEKGGIVQVFDLLRISADRLHTLVKSNASLEQVNDWIRMAHFLEIPGMNPQWAEALAKHKKAGIEKFTQLNLFEIQEIMAEAKERNLINELPAPEQIFDLMKGAVKNLFGGTVTGRIVNEQDQPVANASIRIGFGQTQTNERGYFRFSAIRSDYPRRMVISSPEYADLTIPDSPIEWRNRTINLMKVVLKTRGVTSPTNKLSEAAGDRLPTPKGQNTRTVELPELRERDLVVATYLYASGDLVKLVSLMKDYENDEFIAYFYKVPKSKLPDSFQLGNLFVFRKGEFKRRVSTPWSIHRYKVATQVQQQMKDIPVPKTEPEVGNYIQEGIRLLKAKGYLGKKG